MEWTGSLAGLTDVGESRDHNEDGFLLFDVETGLEIPGEISQQSSQSGPLLLAVSDGMGGASAGEMASAITLETLRDHATGAMGEIATSPPQGLEYWLAEGIHNANRRVLDEGARDATLTGMGATATAVLVLNELLFLAHVGDSRAYLLREGRLLQLTSDHTFVAQLVERGHITPEQAREHEQRHVLVQAVGVREVLDVDTMAFELQPGDRLLLCSDGLYDLIMDEGIAQTLGDGPDPEVQCKALVTAANSLGGYDNVTVIIFHLHPG